MADAAELSAGWIGNLVELARASGVGFGGVVTGICAIVICVRFPAILHGFADVIRARNGETQMVKHRREKLAKADAKPESLEKATPTTEIAQEKGADQ